MLKAFLSGLVISLCVGVGVMILSTAVGCGAPIGASGNAKAVEISGPVGVNCFAILDSAGNPVGGNCLYTR